MNIKEKLEKQIEDYKKIQNYLKENLDSFISSVCEECINYYGEEYRDIITYRIHNTNFIFYVNELEPLLDSFMEVFDRKNLNENYKDIKAQYKEVTGLMKKANGYCERYNEKVKDPKIFRRVNRIVYDSSKTAYSELDRNTHEGAIEELIKKNEICIKTLYLEESNTSEHNIIVPLFKINDEDLIHEIVHAIMLQDLYIKDDTLKYKIGLSTNKDSEELLEECITEIEATNISKGLQEKGVSFIEKFFPKYTHPCFYDHFIPFVKDFYYSFKDALTYSRITLNKSYLLEQIDRNNYYDFMVAFTECFREYFSKDDFYYYQTKIGKEIDKMKDSYKVLKLK